MKPDDLSKINFRPTSIEECWDVIGKLVAMIQQLQECLNTNSKNSSSFPSRDFKKNKAKKTSGGRKPGAQPGYPGVTRRLVSLEQVDEVIACLPPDVCTDCAQPLVRVPKIIRQQVYELLEPRYTIKEYQINHVQCSDCYKTYAGKLPAVVGKHGFGPSVHALLSILTTKFRQSKRQALKLLQDFYGMPLCVGSVSNMEGRVSQAIEPIHGLAWIMASPEWTYFHCALSRGKTVAKQLLKNFSAQIIVSDRHSAYNYLPESHHQICRVHLKRDFTKMAQRSGVGRRLLRSYGKIFAFWKALRAADFKLNKRTHKKRRYLKNVLARHLNSGSHCGHAQTQRICLNLLAQGASLWLFLDNPLVPATNNLAEQQLRPLVIAKKLSLGVKFDRGARFIEKAFSVVASCGQQKRNALTLFQKAFSYHFSGLAPPAFC